MGDLSQQAEKIRDDIGDNPYLRTQGSMQKPFSVVSSSTEIAEQERIEANAESYRMTGDAQFSGARNTIGSIIAERIQADQKANSERQKSDAYFILMQNNIASAQAKYNHYDDVYNGIQSIFDQYTDEEIIAGEHLNEDGEFHDPKIEDEWDNYCRINGIDPDDPRYRNNPDILQGFQDWVGDHRMQAAHDLSREEQKARDAGLSEEEIAEAKEKAIETTAANRVKYKFQAETQSDLESTQEELSKGNNFEQEVSPDDEAANFETRISALKAVGLEHSEFVTCAAAAFNEMSIENQEMFASMDDYRPLVESIKDLNNGSQNSSTVEKSMELDPTRKGMG